MGEAVCHRRAQLDIGRSRGRTYLQTGSSVAPGINIRFGLMALHLLRFDPDVARVAAWFSAEGLTPRDQEDEGYGWHALFTAAFGRDLAPKPFRVLTRRGRSTQVLAYAQVDAAALRACGSDFADPKLMAALGV